MRILVMNWRDIRNPAHGGAEVVTHEHLKRWVAEGHECFLIASAFEGCKDVEDIDGYRVYRAGGNLSVYFHAFFIYRKYFSGNIDVVIDEINTVPFFTPLYVRGARIVSFIHQLCREMWFYEKPFPVSVIGYLAEPLYLMLYRSYPSIVVSGSTKSDLLRNGFRNSIKVIPEGIGFQPARHVPEKERNVLIYVGRIKKSKRVHHIIEAVGILRENIPRIMLWVVGDGDLEYKKSLENLVVRLGLEDNVRFFGYVGPEERNVLMGRAEAIVVASVKEGWGLIVSEANAMGTPAIVYDVDGLRDAVRNRETGLICPNQAPLDLSRTIAYFLSSSDLKRRLSENSLKSSRDFTWERSADESLRFFSK